MGTSVYSVHVWGNFAPAGCGFSFHSFSPNWLTCTNDFSGEEPDYPYQAARLISKETDAPVLHFKLCDHEMLQFSFFHKGKVVSRYSDDPFISNKQLFSIPALIGYGDGQKKRLSSLLDCSDVHLKIEMLEEYFGVCLRYSPEFSDKPETLCRKRSDVLYKKYQEEERTLHGKAAPFQLKLTAEYPGKLFWDVFGSHETIKPHFFLYGYTSGSSSVGNHTLTPVQFTGGNLEVSDPETFSRGRILHQREDSRFHLHDEPWYKVTFSHECPPDYHGRTMTPPNGFVPLEFLPSGELLLWGDRRIFVMDRTFKVIAKLPIKGGIADIADDHILTVTGDSFCGYCYEPNARIYIYKIIRNDTSHAK